MLETRELRSLLAILNVRYVPFDRFLSLGRRPAHAYMQAGLLVLLSLSFSLCYQPGEMDRASSICS